uniref:Uncharacterized protein n=1 Tax=Nelumbo nucifera TaxID=4432 RepID=A0A822ZAL0_NELNU|nr:TPA_asm: hypothetical protein HUJ06_012880 [Nelumbo nucifera]
MALETGLDHDEISYQGGAQHNMLVSNGIVGSEFAFRIFLFLAGLRQKVYDTFLAEFPLCYVY